MDSGQFYTMLERLELQTQKASPVPAQEMDLFWFMGRGGVHIGSQLHLELWDLGAVQARGLITA